MTEHPKGHGRGRVSVPDLIVRGGTVLTLVDGQEPLRGAEVWIRHGRISGVHVAGSGPRARLDGVETIDAGRSIVLPGLINAHCHSAMTLFRGYADDLSLKKWLFERVFPAEAAFLTEETVYWGTLLACLEMIASGTTCFVDAYFFEDGAVKAVREAGLRALLAQGIIDFPAPGAPDPAENLKTGRAFVEKWLGVSDRILPGLFCHSPGTCSEKTLREAWELSGEMGLPLQIHLSETREEMRELTRRTGKRPVAYLDGIRLLDRGLIAAHAVHLDADEKALLAERGVKVVHVPESNMKLGSGVADVAGMMDLGLTVAIGTDGCASNNDLDMFQEMDTAAKLAKVYGRDPQVLPASAVLRMATVNGAAMLGLENELGTLEQGKRADLIVVDTVAPHMCPLYDPFSALVYAANGADVTHVIVDGEVIYRNRRFCTLDAGRIMAKIGGIAAGIGGRQAA